MIQFIVNDIETIARQGFETLNYSAEGLGRVLQSTSLTKLSMDQIAAVFDIGWCFLTGFGAPESPEKALFWYLIAALAGIPKARRLAQSIADVNDIHEYTQLITRLKAQDLEDSQAVLERDALLNQVYKNSAYTIFSAKETIKDPEIRAPLDIALVTTICNRFGLYPPNPLLFESIVSSLEDITRPYFVQVEGIVIDLLTFIVTTGQKWALDFLLSKLGLDVNHKSFCGYTPLHMAAALGDYHMLKHLLAKAHINITMETNPSREPWTPLHLICRLQSTTTTACINLLLANGANVNQGLERGTTPLQVAVKFGNVVAAKILIAKGASPGPGYISCLLYSQIDNFSDIMVDLEKGPPDIQPNPTTRFQEWLRFTYRFDDILFRTQYHGQKRDQRAKKIAQHLAQSADRGNLLFEMLRMSITRGGIDHAVAILQLDGQMAEALAARKSGIGECIMLAMAQSHFGIFELLVKKFPSVLCADWLGMSFPGRLCLVRPGELDKFADLMFQVLKENDYQIEGRQYSILEFGGPLGIALIKKRLDVATKLCLNGYSLSLKVPVPGTPRFSTILHGISSKCQDDRDYILSTAFMLKPSDSRILTAQFDVDQLGQTVYHWLAADFGLEYPGMRLRTLDTSILICELKCRF